MRPRDVRAISFCVLATLLIFGLVNFAANNVLLGVAAAGLALTLMLRHPRMVRVRRRLRHGSTDPWDGYYWD